MSEAEKNYNEKDGVEMSYENEKNDEFSEVGEDSVKSAEHCSKTSDAGYSKPNDEGYSKLSGEYCESGSGFSDEYFMRVAMEEARAAEELDEVPIGAVAVRDGRIIARGHNTRETAKCATGHAEINCINEACRTLGGWRLPGVTLYVTLEPCAMCAGAIINARIPKVVFGAADHRFGALGSLVDLAKIPFNHIPTVEGGVLSEECAKLLGDYFKKKRKKSVAPEAN